MNDVDKFNSYLLKLSKGFLYGFAGVASYFLLMYSSSTVQALVGVAAGIQVWNWYKNR